MRIKFAFGKRKHAKERELSLQEKFEQRKNEQKVASEKPERFWERRRRIVAEKKIAKEEKRKVKAAMKEESKKAKVAAKEAALKEKRSQEAVRKAKNDNNVEKASAKEEVAKKGSVETTKEKASPAAEKFSILDFLFPRRKKNRQRKAAAKNITPKEVEKKLEKSAQQLRKKKLKKRHERRTAQFRKRMLGSLLVKAGFEVKPEVAQRRIVRFTFIIIALFTFVTLTIAAISETRATPLLLFYAGVWTALFAFVYLFLQMVLYVYLDIRIFQRTKELEEVLPDFLQLTSANISAGMPIDRALWFAVRPNFGVLAKEIESVAKATLAGEELSDSLMQFTERYDSVVLKRSINILLEGLAAGGELADLLNKIALNIQETKILKKEMSANVATYAIFITFASIVMAPILFGLATELLTIIVGITSGLDLSGSSSSMFAINMKTSPDMIVDFRWFSIMMLSVSSLMSASIVSVIRKGRVREGLRNLPIFIAVSLAIYFVTISVLHVMLGSLI